MIKIASLVVHARCDEFMELVFNIMNEDYNISPPITTPTFKLNRRIVIETRKSQNEVQVFAVDIDGKPASIFSGVDLYQQLQEEEPFIFEYQGDQTDLILHPMGHYNEPPFDISLTLPEEDHSQLVYDLQYDHLEGSWSIEQKFPK